MAVLAIMTPIILETLSQSLGTSFRQGFIDCEQSLFFFRFSERCTHTGAAKPRDARNEGQPEEEKRETARLARANELSVGLTTQNANG